MFKKFSSRKQYYQCCIFQPANRYQVCWSKYFFFFAGQNMFLHFYSLYPKLDVKEVKHEVKKNADPLRSNDDFYLSDLLLIISFILLIFLN